MRPQSDQLVENFLGVHAQFHPVDASFMGWPDHDHRLPPADPQTPQREQEALGSLQLALSNLPPAQDAIQKLELRMLDSQLKHAQRELQQRPRFDNPSWYTGEAAFGLISLLLPRQQAPNPDSLRQRLEQLPLFLLQGAAHLSNRPTPAGWVQRALAEAKALGTLLQRGLPQHPLWNTAWAPQVTAAVQALDQLTHALGSCPPRDARCGQDYLGFLLQQVHGLPYSVEEAAAMAREGVEQARLELHQLAQKLDWGCSWQEQLGRLEQLQPSLDEVLPLCQSLHQQAMEMADAANLLTPASQYGLEFRWLPDWAREVAGSLYFLFYRSPPAFAAGEGSVYWIFPPGDDLAAYLRSNHLAHLKSTHVVHHGSVGHHTQNARARMSKVQLGRVAGTDCALGIGMLGGGTLIEGWACHSQFLMLEAEGFYSPAETLLLKYAELRNAVLCLADIQLHSQAWTLQQTSGFIHQELGMPPQRSASELNRNSLFPATRLMYWLGTQVIRQARSRWPGSSRTFHDQLLSWGSLPVAWVVETMEDGTATYR